MPAPGERTAQLALAATGAIPLVAQTASVVGESGRVDTPHPAYARMHARYTRCRAAMQGTDAWRALDRSVLPQLEGETDASYEVRKAGAALHPGFEKAVEVGTGLLLQHEPTLDGDHAPEIAPFWEDVTGDGTHATLFCDDLVTAAMVDGEAGIFTDYTRSDDPTLDRSKASAAAVPGAELDSSDTQALGLRPYFVLVKADEIIKAVYQTIGGVKTLVLFVRRQTVTRQVGDFGMETVTQYRAYRLRGQTVTCQIFEQREGQAQPEKVGAPIVVKNQTTIPWSPLRGGQRISDQETKPALMGLCDLVEQYHQLWSNMLSCIQLSSTSTLVRIGATADPQTGLYPPVTIGPRGTLEAPIIEGVPQPIYWINASSDAVAPAEQALVRTETLMGLASASFLAPDKRAAETEKSKQLAAKAGNATLSGVGRRLQDCLELALLHVARFLHGPSATSGSVTVRLDFEDALMEADVMAQYASLVEKGFSKRLALEALQVGGRIKADANIEELADEWEGELLRREQVKKVDAQAKAAELAARGQELANAA